jgi:SPP1 gp7 family putative phage head morphogenesis protein
MIQVVIQPIVQRDALHRDVEREIVAYFEEVLFAPLLAILDDAGINPGRQNASLSAVTSALRARTLWYADGVFTGQFNSAVSRELREMGAVHDKRLRVFKLPVAKLPMGLRLTIADSDAAAKAATKRILDTLNAMEQHVKDAPTGVRMQSPVEDMLGNLRQQFADGLEKKGIAVPPDLTPDVRKAIADEYTNNLDLFIKKFTTERIPVLRARVQENAFAGGRTDKLVKVLQSEFGVSKRKAAFLAEQETSILVAKYRESRYKRIGSRRYVWVTGHDGRVRPDHAALNKQIFDWDNPPITNRATGERNNPGEDYGCRCRARPILNIQEN